MKGWSSWFISKYLKENNIKVAKFKDGRLGPDWLKLFMKPNKLSFKKANMISATIGNIKSVYNFQFLWPVWSNSDSK